MSRRGNNYPLQKRIGLPRAHVDRRRVRCAVCGTVNVLRNYGCVRNFGYEKLVSDNRNKTKSVERLTTIFRCRKCGYVSDLLGRATPEDKVTVRSAEYKLCGGHAFPKTAAMFYRRAIIELNRDKPDYARVFRNYDYAARGCDKKSRFYLAELCRVKAYRAYKKIPAEQHTEDATVNCIDILRRAHRFKRAIAMCDDFKPSAEEAKVITAFEKSRCEKRNAKCFSAEEAYEFYLSEKFGVKSD